MPISLKRYILLFPLFFLLFYVESIKIGSTAVSQLWKIPLALYMLYYVFQYRHMPTPLWSKVQYWQSLKWIFTAGYVTQFMFNLQTCVKFLFLPLLFNSIRNKDWNIEQVRAILLTIVQYFVLTNIPFLFFGFKGISHGHDYGTYVAYSGIFQNQHAMSVIMAICIIVILAYIQKQYIVGRWNIAYNIFLLCVATYAMYLGFARTGWLMCLLAIIVVFWPKDATAKQWIAMAIVGVVLIGSLSYLMSTDTMFYDRIVGNNITTHEHMNVTSGRTEYSAAALERFMNGNPIEWIVGVSTENIYDAIFLKTRMRVGAHNGFVDVLTRNGIIGLGLMVIFLISLLLFIRRRKNCDSYRMALSMWVMIFSFQITQGGVMFHTDLLYALIFCILEKEDLLLTDKQVQDATI